MPSGTPAFNKLIKIGIEEQEQKGVMAPKAAAKKLPLTPPRLIHCRSRCSGSHVRIRLMASIMIVSKPKILIES